MRRLILIAALQIAAGTAHAADLPPRAEEILDSGRPYVEVSPDPDGVSGMILGAIDIAAPQKAVWDVISDCSLATKMAPSLKSCRIVDRDPQGRWDVREQISRMNFMPSIRSVFRSDYEPPDRIRFHQVGGDLPVFEGQWRIEPHDGEVRVIYEARAAAPFSVPGWAARIAMRHDVPQALMSLRREVLAKAP
jgi:carbon monoxide dehydrogenase subunit G